MRNRVSLILAILIVIASLLQLISGMKRVLDERMLIDFDVYYHAAVTVLSGGNPYTRSYGDNIVFNYPPSSLLLFAPFGLLPQYTSQIIFTSLSLIALFASGLLLIGLYPKRPGLTVQLLIVALLLQNFPTKFTLVLGQVNLFVLLFLTLSFYSAQKGKNVASGLLWAAAAMVKLIPLYLGIYFLVNKKYKALVAGLVFFVATNILIMGLFLNEPTFFTRNLPQLAVQTVTTSSIYDQSLRAFISRVSLQRISPSLSLIITATLTVIVLIKYKKIRRYKHIQYNENLRFFSLLLILSTIGHSYAWQHHFVMLFPGYISETFYLLLLRRRVRDTSDGGRLIPSLRGRSHDSSEVEKSKQRLIIRGSLLLLSAILVGYHFPDIAQPPTTNPFLVSHTLMGALILIGLLLT